MTASAARARWAISAQFFTNGVLGGSLLPRLPEIKESFALSDTAYGLVVVALPLGSVLAAAVAGPLIRRFGAIRVAVSFTVVYALLLAAAGFAPSAIVFAPVMLLAGVSDAILDSGQNVHGMAVERWYGKSIINSMHAAWSVGATVGGVIGATSAGLGIPIGWQMAAGAVVWSAVAVLAGRGAAVPSRYVRAATPEADPPTAEPASAGPGAVGPGAGGVGADAGDMGPAASGAGSVSGPARRPFPWRLFLPLAVLAIAGTLVEDVANNWVTLYLNRDMGVAIGLAGMGFAVMLGAQFVGRILGDPMTDRWGRSAVARTGGFMIAAGGLLAVVAPAWWIAMAGFALAGFGSATLVPAAFAAADALPGVPHGTGVAMVGWWMRLGFLLTSPAIGVVADAAGLRAGLLLLVGAGVVALVLAHRRRGTAPGRGS